jgi:putative ubiquitin-RnfH superfamily antitoxin RatB of RatAB toxin-antitoxin module
VLVEVVYALATEQFVLARELPDGATLADALAAVSGERPFCDLDLATVPVGIHGQLAARDALLHEGDRVEIYRPLLTDPMEARRRRAVGG